MNEDLLPIIRRHNVPHIAELKVDRRMFDVKFSSACATSRCSGTCCKGGVWLDLAERERILANVELVQSEMDPHQISDPAQWFMDEVKPDADFPSGSCDGTTEQSYGCVFLNGSGMCVLQIAQKKLPEGSPQLKPFFCYAFPISIEHGVLLYDHYMGSDQPQCCSPSLGAEQNVFDLCGFELDLVLGKEGMEELREISNTNFGATAEVSVPRETPG
ncbi:MAG TPA: DUF3109 family protein [Bacteroidota bacterium]|nr:DUF3109 family protein [Bacteroidota bacterium]